MITSKSNGLQAQGYRYLRSLIKFIPGQPELTGVCIYLRSKLLDRFKWITYMGVNLPKKYPIIVMVLHFVESFTTSGRRLYQTYWL